MWKSREFRACALPRRRKSGRTTLDQERREFLAVDLCEDGEEIGEPGVGDPHFFAIQRVVLAVGRKLGTRANFIASEPEVASERA